MGSVSWNSHIYLSLVLSTEKMFSAHYSYKSVAVWFLNVIKLNYEFPIVLNTVYTFYAYIFDINNLS